MQKNEEELLHSDVYTPMFFDFFEDIKIYISEDLHADDSVFYDLYEHYVDIVKMSQVENDDTFDQY